MNSTTVEDMEQDPVDEIDSKIQVVGTGTGTGTMETSTSGTCDPDCDLVNNRKRSIADDGLDPEKGCTEPKRPHLITTDTNINSDRPSTPNSQTQFDRNAILYRIVQSLKNSDMLDAPSLDLGEPSDSNFMQEQSFDT